MSESIASLPMSLSRSQVWSFMLHTIQFHLNFVRIKSSAAWLVATICSRFFIYAYRWYAPRHMTTACTVLARTGIISHTQRHVHDALIIITFRAFNLRQVGCISYFPTHVHALDQWSWDISWSIIYCAVALLLMALISMNLRRFEIQEGSRQQLTKTAH